MENDKLELVKKILQFLFTYRLSRRNTLVIYVAGLVLLFVITFVFGLYLIHLPENKVLKIYDYETECLNFHDCIVKFHVPQKLNSPIQIFYQLENFIQNTRDYILSKNYAQLKGKDITDEEANKCNPYKLNRDMNVTHSYAGYKLNADAVSSPCGLQARLYFNDTFRLYKGSIQIPIDRKANITKFKKPENSHMVQWIDPTTDSFEIWMTTSINPNLQKYYGKIERDLQKGNYSVRINNIMDYSPFVSNYQKNFYLFKEQNPYGQKKVLAFILIVGSSLLLIIILIIVIRNWKNQGEEDDE